MKKLFIFLFIILCVSAYSNPRVNVPFMTSAPTIDGVVNETEWQEASGISDFVVYTMSKKAPFETKVYLGYKDNTLYIAYKCYGDERPVAKNTDREFGKFWEDDDIEFVFAPNIELSASYQVMVNGTGKFREVSHDFPQKYLDIVSAARICDGYDKMGATYEDKRWEGEMSIGLDSLDINKEISNVRFMIIRHVSELGKDMTSNFVFVDITNPFTNETQLWNPAFYADLTFGAVPSVKNTDQKGTKWTFYNPKNLPLTYSLMKDEVIYEGPLEENKDYYELLPKGIYNYKYSVQCGDTLLFENTTKSQKAEYINYRQEGDILYIDLNYEGVEKQSPLEVFVKSGDHIYYGASLYVIPGKTPNKTLTFDMSKCPHGEYIIDFSLGTTFNKKINITH
ncbi:MAG: carbohydrate-binding family 9-like protein [Abditibacteriota bacterium]|nr:carbohydrate-binding family 9-like protein [Abditibacteriota bacterium]